MKEEKNLDRLFQEKFKDFERHPSDAVWKNISAAQKEEKEDRKVIPLWWKLGGTAAVIAILFTAGMSFFKEKPSKSLENVIVTTSTVNETSPTTSTLTGKDSEATTSEVTTVAKEENKINSNVNIKTPSNTATVVATNAPNRNNAALNKAVKGNSAARSASQNQNPIATIFPKNNTAIVNNDQKSTTPSQVDSPSMREEVLEQQLKEATTKVTQSHKENKALENTSQEVSNEKISLIDEANRITQENEAISMVENTTDTRKWDVGAVAAPVYFGDFGGSGIDPAFSDNAKSGDVNFSYGVQVSYNISPKLKVRAGVNNVDLSYNTDGIAFIAAPGARRLSGINYNENAQALNIADAGSTRLANAAQDELFGENANNAQITNGSLQQRIGFVEIPLEGVYVISDKRLGVQVVGGISTLLLNNNEVILNAADGLQSNLGSANGVNDVSFTTNVGVGLDYKMTDKLKLNVEPSLKYQLNAFDQSVGDFKPYFIGLYTGVSYRF